VLIFVDCEAVGPCPSIGTLTEFGAVEYVPINDIRRAEIGTFEKPDCFGDPGPVGQTFHGRIFDAVPGPENPKVSSAASLLRPIASAEAVFVAFDMWLAALRPKGGVSFVSDNPAFDWMWICDGLWRHVGRNRFGHSARRIGDFYAGLTNDHSNTQRWKRLRVTPHDHNPVHDAMGNVEAFDRILKGERA
jgi:hypothetical protein